MKTFLQTIGVCGGLLVCSTCPTAHAWGYTAADNTAAAQNAPAIDVTVKELVRILQEDLKPFIQADSIQEVQVKEVPAATFDKIDAVFPMPEKWMYAEYNSAGVLTVYLNEKLKGSKSKDRKQAQHRAEAMAFAVGRAVMAATEKNYWKAGEQSPLPPAYDAQQQVNPAFVLACHFAAVCRSRITHQPATLHDYARDLAGTNPRWKKAAEDCIAHYPETAKELSGMLGYETLWISARNETARYMSPEGEDFRLLTPVLEEMEQLNDPPRSQRAYIQGKYPLLQEPDNETDGEKAGNMMSRVRRHVTQRRTVALAHQLLQWQDRRDFWEPDALESGTEEYEQRDRFLREMSDLMCEELVQAIRRATYVAARMQNQENALKYEEEFLSCWKDIHHMAAPLIALGETYHHDLNWAFDSRTGYEVLRESAALYYYMQPFENNRMTWYGAEHGQEFQDKMYQFDAPAYLILSAGAEKLKFEKMMENIRHENDKKNAR